MQENQEFLFQGKIFQALHLSDTTCILEVGEIYTASVLKVVLHLLVAYDLELISVTLDSSESVGIFDAGKIYTASVLKVAFDQLLPYDVE